MADIDAVVRDLMAQADAAMDAIRGSAMRGNMPLQIIEMHELDVKIDWPACCNKCSRVFSKADLLSELICVESPSKGTRVFLCIDCMQKYFMRMIPADVLRRMGLRIHQNEQLKARKAK